MRERKGGRERSERERGRRGWGREEGFMCREGEVGRKWIMDRSEEWKYIAREE